MIVIESLAGIAMIQDLGRPGHMHEALPPGGALVPELLAIANRAAGNEDGAPAIELYGRMRLRAEGHLVVGTRHRESLLAGAELVVESGRARVAYVALCGGVAAPLVLGGRGAHLSAGIGKLLRAGDRLGGGTCAGATRELGTFTDDGRPLRVVPGPDRVAGALDTLFGGEYQISPASDRVGTRLVGPALSPQGDHVSRPMVKGAIEVPPDGAPIVLGPEHPTTGGYPVIGVIATADLGRFFARPVGAHVRFTPALVPSDAAR